MSDEEKKAIEMLRNYDNEDNLHKIHQSINVVLNLIEKQSKEIEELKEKNENLLDALNNSIDIKKYWVSKDKIKAKIEDLEKQDKESKLSHNYLVIPVLQSLLEKE